MNLKLRPRAVVSRTAVREQELNPVRELEGALLTPVIFIEQNTLLK